ncbi:uncharacterized protein TRAVEDRAFT_160971 [Trametes versicolor FP-101664 SS1]|uniref:uncharacterized protein n=1 Tax=Trametes versicolor (strain FP-101664) TaxID=717944 RepID=UPI000462297B|nr:uncharacterized protein TRAVEDRAFT_160971 [Trametes versicolor FP-101664 SS1]EIW62955.1 hypothetical protein TRAVEDRAFT_160971 [Trametes versicolor FP-101664 SS1]
MVSSSNTISTTNASPPFNRPSADIILRSCDLVDFRVQSGILIEASPFFSDMFELPQPPSSAAEATPVVDMTEDAQTLDLLLRLVYPIVNPPLEEPMLMLLVLKGAAKYDMALPTSVVSKRLLAITPNKTLQVWAAACQVRTGLEDVARQAAVALRASWKHTENEALSLMGNLGDMSGISAGDYLRLKQFLRAPQSDIDAERLALLSPPPEAMARPPPISPTPFSTDLPSPDVICRSLPQGGPGSERSFEAHRLVLSMHSPILKTRLNHTVGEIPSPSDPDSKETSSNDALATLELDEKSDIVSLLLKACYDGEEGLPADLDLATVAELFRASRKYEMTRIARLVCGAWDRVAALNPLEAYLVAINHGLDEYARAAAKNVLMGPIANAYTTVMEDAPALAYHRLLLYHDTCWEVRRERFIAFGSRILNMSTYYGGWPQTSDDNFRKALNDAGRAAHSAPSKGGPKDGLPQFLIDTLSRDGGFRQCGLWRCMQPLLEFVTSVPEAVVAAVDDVQITLT